VSKKKIEWCVGVIKVLAIDSDKNKKIRADSEEFLICFLLVPCHPSVITNELKEKLSKLARVGLGFLDFQVFLSFTKPCTREDKERKNLLEAVGVQW